MENASVFQGLLENTSNVYSDDNENGELEEEEQDTPITELEEEVEYTLEGTWTTDLWYYGNNQGFENAILNLSPDGFLFQADRKSMESNETINEKVLTCNGIDYPEEINKEGEFPTISFANGAMEAQVFYQFLDQDTLIINAFALLKHTKHRITLQIRTLLSALMFPPPRQYHRHYCDPKHKHGDVENPVHTTTAETLYAKACSSRKVSQ